MLRGSTTVLFRASNSGGVFLIRVSDKAKFFLLSKLMCRLANFIRNK